MTAKDVTQNLLALPWVDIAKPDTPCEGIKWSTVALKDIRPVGGEPARGFQERSRCKRKALFSFKALERGRKYETLAKSGSYCKIHTSMQITDSPPEYRRARAWWNKNGWWQNGVFAIHPKEKSND